jgi:hypothetical protein
MRRAPAGFSVREDVSIVGTGCWPGPGVKPRRRSLPAVYRRIKPLRYDIHPRFLVLVSIMILSTALQATAGTRDYAVEVSVTVQESRPRIDVSWRTDATGTDTEGHDVASGIYFVTLKTGHLVLSSKVVRIK